MTPMGSIVNAARPTNGRMADVPVRVRRLAKPSRLGRKDYWLRSATARAILSCERANPLRTSSPPPPPL